MHPVYSREKWMKSVSMGNLRSCNFLTISLNYFICKLSSLLKYFTHVSPNLLYNGFVNFPKSSIKGLAPGQLIRKHWVPWFG